jgi:hypothetical protein
MTKRLDNKRLLYLLTGLVAILILTVIIKIPKENGTLRDKIADFDTSGVAKIIIHPKAGKGDSFELYRQNSKWMVKQGSIESASQPGAVENIFSETLGLKPESLASVNKKEWARYDLTDSLATRIEFLNKKGKRMADLMFGKMDYKQQQNPYAGYGGNNVQVTSYVRLHNENKVYAVSGFISFTFGTSFNDWRDKTFIKTDRNNITRMIFTYPADSSFTLIRNGNLWNIAEAKADSSKVAGYLNTLVQENGQKIMDNFHPSGNPVYQLKIEGNNMKDIDVSCYNNIAGGEYIVNSSLNPEIYFSTKKKEIPDRIFKSAGYFLDKN